MKAHRFFGDFTDTKKTYATVERAAAEAEKLIAEYTEEGTLHYTVGACVIKGATRFYPVFLPTEKHVHVAIALAHRGFPIIRV